MNDQLHAAAALSLTKGRIWGLRIGKALTFKHFYLFSTVSVLISGIMFLSGLAYETPRNFFICWLFKGEMLLL